MSEARDIEEIVTEWEHADADPDCIRHMHSDDQRALIADWRAKKAEIERLNRELEASEFARTHPGDRA